MTTRLSFDDIFLTMAVNLARRSTCRRMKVGCVITSVDHHRVFAIGYNGNAAGGPNDCDRFGEEAVGNCGCIHAEANAVIKCATDEQKIVYVTHLPCVTCAKYIINLGRVRRIVFKNDYRIRDSVEWLGARVAVEHMPLVEADRLEANLSDMQARCTELLEENRALKRQIESR